LPITEVMFRVEMLDGTASITTARPSQGRVEMVVSQAWWTVAGTDAQPARPSALNRNRRRGVDFPGDDVLEDREKKMPNRRRL